MGNISYYSMAHERPIVGVSWKAPLFCQHTEINDILFWINKTQWVLIIQKSTSLISVCVKKKEVFHETFTIGFSQAML